MKNECKVIKVRGKDLEPGDVVQLWDGNRQKWREIMDIFRSPEDLDAHFGAELWRTDGSTYFARLRSSARMLDNWTESYLLARVVVQEESQDGIEDETVMLYDYDLYDTQSLSARE